MSYHGFVSYRDYDHLSDEDLVNRICNGDTSLFEVILRRYNQRLYRIQRGYTHDEQVIKETLQSTYIRCYENLSQFRGEAAFSTWITRIAINEVLKYFNRNKQYAEMQSVEDGEPVDRYVYESEPSSPESRTIQNDIKNRLKEAIDQLPPKYRAVYIMREVENLSTEETSECLKISASNVKVRLHRAKELLREELEGDINKTDLYVFLGKQCDELVLEIMSQIYGSSPSDAATVPEKIMSGIRSIFRG